MADMTHEQAVGHLDATLRFYRGLVTLREIMQLEVDATKAERRVDEARVLLARLAEDAQEQEDALAALATSIEQYKARVEREYKRGNKVRENADVRVERERVRADKKIETIGARVETAQQEASKRLDELAAEKRASEEALAAAKQAHADFIASITPEGSENG